MRRLILPACLALLTGCSNAPIAGFLDCVAPVRDRPRDGRTTPDVRPPIGRPDALPPGTDPFIPPVGPLPPGQGQ